MKSVAELEALALQLRKNIIEMSHLCGRAAHPGPALSCVDIVTALYFDAMNFDPAFPEAEDRDRFILSKGHACPAQYAALTELGLVSREEYPHLRHPDGVLQGHPTYHKTPGVDMTAGSLGNGLGIGLGMAYYQKLRGIDSRVYVILGDGELNEGTVWEAVMCAPTLKTDNLIAFVDVNRFQSCGACSDILQMENIAGSWRSFGWNVLEIDGNSMTQVQDSITEAKSCCGRPTVIVAHTVKGKGVSFMEDDNSWHQRVVTTEQFNKAMAELEENV